MNRRDRTQRRIEAARRRLAPATWTPPAHSLGAEAAAFAGAMRSAFAAFPLPRERRLHAFVRGLPMKTLGGAHAALLRRSAGDPLDPLLQFLASAARLLLKEDPEAFLRQNPHFELTGDELDPTIDRLGLVFVLEVFFRSGLVKSVEYPPDPFAGEIEAIRVDGAPASELDLRRVLGEEDYQRIMADSRRRRLRLS